MKQLIYSKEHVFGLHDLWLLPTLNIRQQWGKINMKIRVLEARYYMYELSHFSWVRPFAILWTVALQPPLSMGFPRQKYCRGLPCPPPGDLPDPGIEPASSVTPALQADPLLWSHQGCPRNHNPREKRPFSSYSQLSWWLRSKESTCQCRRCGFNPWVGKIP